MSADTAAGEFRVPEDVEAERAAALASDENASGENASDENASDEVAEPRRRRRFRRPAPTVDTPAPAVDTPAPAVDTSRTPGPVVGAVALGVVAAPLLGVYAVLFVTRWFLQPGVSPDITSSWTGEGVAGIVAAVLAVAMLVIVARAAGGRALPVFVGAQAVVVATCVYLLSDDASGGRSVTIALGVLALAAIVLALLPVSRRWFAAHTADRAAAG